MPDVTHFWFVRARRDGEPEVCLAVAAFTARSARVQARKQLGTDFVIEDPVPVCYANAWLIDFGSRQLQRRSA